MMRGVQGRARGERGAGSPAAAAGVQGGDVIAALDGSAIRDGSELLQVLAKRQAGDTVKLGVLRDRQNTRNASDAQAPQRTFLKNDKRITDMKPIVYLAHCARPASTHCVAQDDIPLLRAGRTAGRRCPDRRVQPSAQARARPPPPNPPCGSGPATAGSPTAPSSATAARFSPSGAKSPARGANLRVDAGEREPRRQVARASMRTRISLLLEIDGQPLTPVKWSWRAPKLGGFLAAPQPDGRPAAFGVVSVLERNLRDTDQAYLGVIGDPDFAGPGRQNQGSGAGFRCRRRGIEAGQRHPESRRTPDLRAVGTEERAGRRRTRAPRFRCSSERERRRKIVEVLLGNRPQLPQYPRRPPAADGAHGRPDQPGARFLHPA